MLYRLCKLKCVPNCALTCDSEEVYRCYNAPHYSADSDITRYDSVFLAAWRQIHQ